MYVDRPTTSPRTGRLPLLPMMPSPVMREAIEGKIGIGKVGLYGREDVVAIKPLGRGLVMHTLHHADEMQTMDAVEELNGVPPTVTPS